MPVRPAPALDRFPSKLSSELHLHMEEHDHTRRVFRWPGEARDAVRSFLANKQDGCVPMLTFIKRPVFPTKREGNNTFTVFDLLTLSQPQYSLVKRRFIGECFRAIVGSALVAFVIALAFFLDHPPCDSSLIPPEGNKSTIATAIFNWCKSPFHSLSS